MSKTLTIEGGKQLLGHMPSQGAKNSALSLIPATLFSDKVSTLHNIPDIGDIRIAFDLIRHLGGEITELSPGSFRIDPRSINSWVIGGEYSRSFRGALYFLPPLLHRFGRVSMHWPGGCDLGDRKFDFHLNGLRLLGASVEEKGDELALRASRLKGAEIDLPSPSHMATSNLLGAASVAEGGTLITNASRNPEVVDRANFLRSMGVQIFGDGTSDLEVNQTGSLQGTTYTCMIDRVVFCTNLAIAALVGTDMTLDSGCLPLISAEYNVLRRMGIGIEDLGNGKCRISKTRHMTATDIVTGPYPEFCTDIQPIFAVMMTQAEGISRIFETMFNRRFSFAQALRTMGANIQVETADFLCPSGNVGQVCTIKGGTLLRGSEVTAQDLRGAACLVVAGLAATGTTRITNIDTFLRGYEAVPAGLNNLGADMWIDAGGVA